MPFQEGFDYLRSFVVIAGARHDLSTLKMCVRVSEKFSFDSCEFSEKIIIFWKQWYTVKIPASFESIRNESKVYNAPSNKIIRCFGGLDSHPF